MRAQRALAAVVLAGSMHGVAGPSPRDPYPDPSGPTCYGQNYSEHVWNLMTPQDVYGVDSCVAAQLVAQRNVAGNLAMYITLVSARVQVLVPDAIFAMAWNTSTTFLANCASRGTGVEFVQDARTGVILGCHAQ
jgi:hypothetical protein